MPIRRVSVLHAWGAGQGTDQLHVELRDEALISQIGVVEDDVEFPDVTDPAELLAKAQDEFNKRKSVFTRAVVRVPRSVLPDDLTVGDVVTLVDPSSGTVVPIEVKEIAIDEDADEGEIVRLGLGTTIPDYIDAILAGRAKPTGLRPSIYLPAPMVRARGRRGAIVLTWNLINGSDGYDIEVSEDGVTWTLLASRVPGPEYVHSGLPFGATRRYRVYARSGDRRSLPSNVATASARDTTAPSPPAGLTATPGPGKVVRLSWTAPPDEDVWEYHVYRKPGNSPNDPTGAVMIASEAGLQHIDTTGDEEATYTWFVTAVDDSENESGFSLPGVVATVPKQGGVDTTPPASLEGIGLSVSGHALYQDGQGNWFVRATLSLTGIPSDARRAYVQIKHRRSGSATWALDDQLYVASGNATASVDDLLPNVTYEYAAVPVSHYGIEGTGKTASATTPKDTSAPPTPPKPTVTSIIRGIRVSVPRPSAPDWKLTRVRIKASSGGAAILTVEGAQTEFEITAGLTAGTTYWADAQYEDTSGNVSGWSAEASAVALSVQGGDIGSGQVGTVHIVQNSISGLEVLEVNDDAGTSTTSTSYVDIPGFSITFSLEEPATVLILAGCSMATNGIAQGGSFTLNLDGSDLTTGVERDVVGDETGLHEFSIATHTLRSLSAGPHTVKGRFRRATSDINSMKIFDRNLSVLILKR